MMAYLEAHLKGWMSFLLTLLSTVRRTKRSRVKEAENCGEAIRETDSFRPNLILMVLYCLTDHAAN